MSNTYAPSPATAQAPTHAHTTTSTPALATAQAPASAHTTASPANGLCHLTLGPHMLCLFVHVSHPCTRVIVQQAPPVSPAKCQCH
ncbi:hypothetical protein O181_059149 [Austropuccinia psidii MF-1]|uniref:Uncharacterized protein n=1 Tax=Austropuccinia psidii MF-1 TaxID=1389203 RepID=A0A9Q3EDR3_9BASI|nr:hypothetical protein [Austropuccinia psidii MF-1]